MYVQRFKPQLGSNDGTRCCGRSGHGHFARGINFDSPEARNHDNLYIKGRNSNFIQIRLCASGIHLVRLWDTSGVYMGHVWCISGLYLHHLWGYIWDIAGDKCGIRYEGVAKNVSKNKILPPKRHVRNGPRTPQKTRGRTYALARCSASASCTRAWPSAQAASARGAFPPCRLLVDRCGQRCKLFILPRF